MKFALQIFTLTLFACTGSSVFAEAYYSETHEEYTLKSQWQCPNKKNFETEAAARKACGNQAKMVYVDEQGKTVSLF